MNLKGSKTEKNLHGGAVPGTIDNPEECPVCNHPQSYFQVLAENY